MCGVCSVCACVCGVCVCECVNKCNSSKPVFFVRCLRLCVFKPVCAKTSGTMQGVSVTGRLSGCVYMCVYTVLSIFTSNQFPVRAAVGAVTERV